MAGVAECDVGRLLFARGGGSRESEKMREKEVLLVQSFAMDISVK